MATASGGQRLICINDPVRNSTSKFLHNSVSTAKYTAFTFLFKFFFEQFRKYANIFFLFTALIQQIPNVSPTSRYTTIMPLAFVLLVSAVKEVLEDYRRHQSDAEGTPLFFPKRYIVVVNVRVTKRLVNGNFQDVLWRDVNVGDLIRVQNNEFFPADMILLSSSEPDALCYIETSNLDGETNLKIRQGLPETAKVLSSGEAAKLTGTIRSEQPNNSLYTYEGVMTLGDGVDVAVGPSQLLLRGAMLRNTPWAYGIVVFTGHESKLMRNATAAPIKQTSVEKMTNRQIILLFLILIVLALVSTIGTISFANAHLEESDWYLNLSNVSGFLEILKDFLTFIILYNNLIPISLIVTMEVVKTVQARLINNDLDMYHEKSDTPAQVRTSSLVEELGQIEYIFSDKTGTLTCNEMEFRQCSIGGKMYSDFVPDGKRVRIDEHTGEEVGQYTFQQLSEHLNSLDGSQGTQKQAHAQVLNEFLTLLAVCQTVIPERKEEQPGKPIPTRLQDQFNYQASSPDEGALVKGAGILDYVFHTRKPKSVIINVRGRDLEYEILNVNEFNSTRKRMSTVIREPSGKIILYIKGADTVILERLKRSPDGSYGAANPFVDTTLRHLEDYATEGLRTLCLAMREISNEEYAAWSVQYDKAATTINNRQQALDDVAELIEKDLIFLGSTAIEDKLQDGVPDTIFTMAQAGIKIWVLTGDRQETAINIGYSCKLLTEEMSLIFLNEETLQATKNAIQFKLQAIKDYLARNGIVDTAPVPKKYRNMRSVRSRLTFGALSTTTDRLAKNFKEDKAKLINPLIIGSEPASPVAPLPPLEKDGDEPIDAQSLDNLALIIDGHTLKYALDPSLSIDFLDLATRCKAVICCRVSPLQKALVVKLVKKNLKAITLAIGDGANDVSMIQAAHVGIGISGNEGLQAARSSDFAIAQFRFLRKLVLVHGLWCYVRLSKLILYSFYKNITLYMTQFWFAFYNGFSGQTVYESWLISFFNMIFTAFPPLAIGIFEQSIAARMLDRYPQIYQIGQKSELFNVPTFWGWAINAIYHSFLLYFLLFNGFAKDDLVLGSPEAYRGEMAGLWYVGTLLYTAVLATVLWKAAFTVDNWNVYTWLMIPGSFVLWITFLPIYAAGVGPNVISGFELTGLIPPLYGNPAFWFAWIVVPILCISRDYVWKYWKRQYGVRTYHIVQEIQKFGIPDYRPHAERFRKAVVKVRQIQRMRRTRGFAFSQNEEGQAQLIRQYDTTVKKPKGL